MMAGARITVEFDDAQVRRALGRLRAAVADMTPVMVDVGHHLVNTTRQRFFDEETPEGQPWAPLSETTRRRKKKNVGKVLTEEGTLRGGIAHQAGPDGVDVGASIIYAGVHQFGAAKGAFGATSKGGPIPWGDIPARPFLGLSNEDEDEIAALVADYLRLALGAP